MTPQPFPDGSPGEDGPDTSRRGVGARPAGDHRYPAGPERPEPIYCFLIEDSGRDQVSFRRWTRRRADTTGDCPVHGRHAAVRISFHRSEEPATSRISRHDDESFAPDDPRWPSTCECGYRFADDDHFHSLREPLYVGPPPDQDAMMLVTLNQAPPGAIWRAPWLEEYRQSRGPDGHSYVCMLPTGPWLIDGVAKGGKRWTRSGDPPRFTVRPSVIHLRADSLEAYCGLLTDGVVEPL